MLGLILSTIAFFAASFYLSRYLDEQGMNKGVSRSVLVFFLATLISISTSSIVDYASDVFDGGHSKMASSDPMQMGNITQLIHSLSAVQGR